MIFITSGWDNNPAAANKTMNAQLNKPMSSIGGRGGSRFDPSDLDIDWIYWLPTEAGVSRCGSNRMNDSQWRYRLLAKIFMCAWGRDRSHQNKDI